jgi:hypothetical protein
MTEADSEGDLLEFLAHASDRGLMPATTASALAVAVRNVLGILDENERANLGGVDLDAVIKRFNNKRAKDFNPSTVKAYGVRVRRAIELYREWQSDPANFSARTRAPRLSKGRTPNAPEDLESRPPQLPEPIPGFDATGRGYQSAFPIRPGTVVTLSNIPGDLTSDEAERLAQFVKMLAVP